MKTKTLHCERSTASMTANGVGSCSTGYAYRMPQLLFFFGGGKASFVCSGYMLHRFMRARVQVNRHRPLPTRNRKHCAARR